MFMSFWHPTYNPHQLKRKKGTSSPAGAKLGLEKRGM
jgi:hypothetical protein